MKSVGKSYKGFMNVLISALLWGTLPIFSKFVYANGSEPLTAAAWRSYLSAGIFFVWFLLDGSLKKLKWKVLPYYLMMGVVAVGGTFYLYMKAVETRSVAMAAMLLYTAPSFVILLNRLFYKEPITPAKLVSLLCALVGCVLVTQAYDLRSLAANGRGLLLGLGSGFCYSLTTVVGKKRSSGITGRQNAGFLILFSPVTFLFIRPVWTLALPTPPQLLGYLGLAGIGSVLAYVFYMRGLETGMDGGIASITASFEVVVATVLGAVLFGETFDVLQLTGMLIMMAGIILSQLAVGHVRHRAAVEQG